MILCLPKNDGGLTLIYGVIALYVKKIITNLCLLLLLRLCMDFNETLQICCTSNDLVPPKNIFGSDPYLQSYCPLCKKIITNFVLATSPRFMHGF